MNLQHLPFYPGTVRTFQRESDTLVLLSRKVNPPAGTFLAPVRNGVIRLPPPLKQFCEAEGWSLFRFDVMGQDKLRMQPILPKESAGDFSADELCASLSSDGLLWIPGPLREIVSLGEQSVMLRIEDGAIGMYLRKVFKTLGFRP